MGQKKIQGSMEVLSDFQATELTAGMDQASKEICRNKEVLAIILKGVVKEYADYSCEEIMDFIEGDTITDEKQVSPGLTNTQISGGGKEFVVLNEKLAAFDTSFCAVNPKKSDREIIVRLHIDVEPQKNARPGYPIEKRGIYYLARMLSSQLSLALKDTDYSVLEKCYSIFICRDRIPEDEKFSVSILEMSNTENYGNCRMDPDHYDLMTLVIIRLGDSVYRKMENEKMDSMMEFIHAIMYPHREDFMETVKKHIDFSKNEKLWKELNDMGGLGASILEEGIEQGIERGIERGIEQGIKRGIEQGIERGIEQGIERGIEQGIRGAISLLRKLGCPDLQIKEQIIQEYFITEAEADKYMGDCI